MICDNLKWPLSPLKAQKFDQSEIVKEKEDW